MSADIASVSYVLSSIASVGRILESIFNLSKRGVTPTPEEFEKISAEAQAEVDKQATAGAFTQPDFAKALSDDVLDVIKKEIDRIKQNITKVFHDRSMSEGQKREALVRNRREYCFHLHEIKNFNGKTLPPEMEQEWTRLDCGEYHFG